MSQADFKYDETIDIDVRDSAGHVAHFNHITVVTPSGARLMQIGDCGKETIRMECKFKKPLEITLVFDAIIEKDKNTEH